MRRIAEAIILSWGWRRALWAMSAGALGALAMPPFGFLPALAVSLPVAVWLIDGASSSIRHATLGAMRSAAFAGWFWGFGYFVAGLWWIGQAFLVEADVFAWLMPFGVLGLPALLAIFPAVGFALARAIWSTGAYRLFALAFGLTFAEWLRGWLFTGFPWNALGMALGQNTALLQSGAVLGLWGMTALAVLISAAPATIATGTDRRNRFAVPALALVTLAFTAALGAWRVSAHPTETVPGVRLRIMQPNLSQDAKFNAGAGATILARYLELSDRATSPVSTGLADVTHLIWPESAFPFLLHREPAALARIGRIVPRGGALVTGAAREGTDQSDAAPGRRFFNSIQVVGEEGAILSTYDKVHLVPFGEYVPHALDAVLTALGIRAFVNIPGGFTAGERRLALFVPGLPPVAGSVCYEAIFPGETMPQGARPGLILNVTNDGWFGDTPGPRQHFAQARLRAVERGLPLVRAANTGISAVVDPYGRIVASLSVGVEGVVDSDLPQAAPPTIYDRFGTLTSGALLLLCGGLAVRGRRRDGRLPRSRG